jgi:Icc-related predicted phosphoesterase
MNVAVFADVHGRLLLCFKLCARWQEETGQKIDLILQCGDLGVFPATSRLDRATLNHARHDPTELGFMHHFLQPDPQVQKVLDRLNCNLIFVRGNHEDHLWLEQLEQASDQPIFPVDVYRRVWCLKTGELYQFRQGAEELNLLGIGRISVPQRAGNNREAIYLQPYEEQKLFRYKRSTRVDVLLTHDRPAIDQRHKDEYELAGTKGGMPQIREALNYYQPTLHFFGHVGGPLYQGQDANGVTSAHKLVDLAWRRDSGQVLEANSMGILRWHSPEDYSFEMVKADWLNEYSAFSWEQID